MRPLILGATGLLGRTLYRRWRERGWEVAGTWHCAALPGLARFELLDRDIEPLLREHEPDVVVIPASNPHVDYCQTHPEETRAINVDATLAAARAALARGARVVFFSSDYVFDGAKGNYSESDPPAPINEYGRQKLAVERELLADPRALVLRVSGLYGWELRPRNFVVSVRERLRKGEMVKAVTDQIYTPAFVEDLAEPLARLIELKESGLFHFTGAEAVDRHAFAVRIARAFGLDPARVVSARSAEFPAAAKRPADSSLSTAKLAKALGGAIRGPSAALPDMARREAEWLDYARTLR